MTANFLKVAGPENNTGLD